MSKKDDRPRPGDTIKPRKPATVQFAATVLQLEAFAVLFAALALYGLRDSAYERGPLVLGTTAALWTVTGVLFLVLVVLSRMVARPGGYLAGSVVQVPVLASSSTRRVLLTPRRGRLRRDVGGLVAARRAHRQGACRVRRGPPGDGAQPLTSRVAST